MTVRRRSLLVSFAALFAAACTRTTSAPLAAAPAAPLDVEPWNQEALGILSDVLRTLRTFDDFQAFRVSSTSDSSVRLASELAWDAPSGPAWDEATHVTRGLHGRADLLFAAVTTAKIDPNQWRSRRALADATHDLLELGDALVAYRDRVDHLAPGDASGALKLLNAAWAQWDTAAARWGISRAETISCEG
ncbi:MAG: hypothetical protein ACR2IK_01635 [Chloroflexota bacterium]